MNKKMILNIFTIAIFFVLLSTTMVFAQGRLDIVFSGSTIGGVTNLQMNGLAAVGKQFCNLEPTVIVSPTLAQVDIMKDGDSDICTTYGYEAYFAYYGQDRWEGDPYTGIRSLMPRPNATVQFAVPAKSDIYSVYDFEGKRICVGRAGFGGELQSRSILDALGINYTPVNLGHDDSLAAIVAGNAEVYSNSGAFPHPSFLEMAETIQGGIRIIGFTEEEMEKILEKAPFFKPATMGPVYKGMPEGDIMVPQVESLIACREEVPEEVIYCLTKSFWENREFASMQWAGYDELVFEDVAGIKGSAPWHIGAYKYYVEQGLQIPENMIPPEAK